MATGRLPSRTYVCPTCGYDVTQTLIDRIHVCPECGTSVNERLCAVIPLGVRLALAATVFLPAGAFLAGLLLEDVVDRAAGVPVSAPVSILCFFGALCLVYFVARATYARFDPRDAKIRAMQLAAAALVTSALLAFLAIFLVGFLGALALSALG